MLCKNDSIHKSYNRLWQKHSDENEAAYHKSQFQALRNKLPGKMEKKKHYSEHRISAFWITIKSAYSNRRQNFSDWFNMKQRAKWNMTILLTFSTDHAKEQGRITTVFHSWGKNVEITISSLIEAIYQTFKKHRKAYMQKQTSHGSLSWQGNKLGRLNGFGVELKLTSS